MHKDCFECNLKQIDKLSQCININDDLKKQLIEVIQDYHQHCDMSQTNPEIMGDIWQRIQPLLKTDNPYRTLKSQYNQLMLSYIQNHQLDHHFDYALKLAVTGNLIDFAAKHSFNDEKLMKMIENASSMHLAIDHSHQLFHQLQESSQLLYIGDNCGEIVLDKYFISVIKRYCPHLQVFYALRGKPIVNDVTKEDAQEVNMHEVATVISSGDGSLGTVLKRTSQEFQDIFFKSDVIICKGQGNYEGLWNEEKENMYFLFMAKCDLVAHQIGVEKMSIVCLRKETFI